MDTPASQNPPALSPRRALLAIAAILAAMFVATTVDLGSPNPNRSMEKICFQSSQETWIRYRDGDPTAWNTPSIYGGILRIRKPPVLVWLNMFAWRHLDPETATVEQLAFRARLVTVLLMLLGAASVGWICWTCFGPRGGILGTLVTASMFVVLKYAHYTMYDPQVMGWGALCTAGGVWAMQPVTTDRWRPYHLLGWLVAGLALGAGVMTKGPVAVAYGLLPLGWMIAVNPDGRRRNLLGLLGAVAVAVALSFWWYWRIYHLGDEIRNALGQEYSAADDEQKRPIFQYLIIFGIVFPWTFWWGGAVVQPFLDRTWRRDRRFWLAWGAFACTFVAIALYPMRNERYLVPVMPSAAFLITAWLLLMIERRPEPPTWVRRCWKGLWIAFGVVSVGFPFFVFFEPVLVSHHLMRRELLGPIAWPLVLAAAVILALIARYGWRATAANRQYAACLFLGAWMIAFVTIGYHGYNRSPKQIYANRADCDRLHDASAGLQLYYLVRPDQPIARPQYAFYMYARRIIRPIRQDQILTRDGSPCLVMARDNPDNRQLLDGLGFRLALTVDEKDWTWLVYHSPPDKPGTD